MVEKKLIWLNNFWNIQSSQNTKNIIEISINYQTKIFESAVKNQKKIIMEANNHQFLQYSLKCLVSMGFVPNQRFNRRLLMQLTTYFLNVSLSVLFLLHDATTFWEYTNSIFICLSSGVCLLLFIIFIFQAEKIFEIIDFGQNFFEDSKFSSDLNTAVFTSFEFYTQNHIQESNVQYPEWITSKRIFESKNGPELHFFSLPYVYRLLPYCQNQFWAIFCTLQPIWAVMRLN